MRIYDITDLDLPINDLAVYAEMAERSILIPSELINDHGVHGSIWSTHGVFTTDVYQMYKDRLQNQKLTKLQYFLLHSLMSLDTTLFSDVELMWKRVEEIYYGEHELSEFVKFFAKGDTFLLW